MDPMETYDYKMECYIQTQQEHTDENLFHEKRINALGDIPFLSQWWPNLPDLEAH